MSQASSLQLKPERHKTFLVKSAMEVEDQEKDRLDKEKTWGGCQPSMNQRKRSCLIEATHVACGRNCLLEQQCTEYFKHQPRAASTCLCSVELATCFKHISPWRASHRRSSSTQNKRLDNKQKTRGCRKQYCVTTDGVSSTTAQ